jgi:dihydroorotate dehydrogenase (NAD+) catalytic subunit
MITLSNGHAFQYMVASGALGFDGRGWPWERPLVWSGHIKSELFTVVIKTLTRHPRKGNLRWWKPWECVRLIPGGSVNKVGLTNRGVEWWCKNVGPKLDFKKFPLVASIYGESDQELLESTEMLNRFRFVGMEVNRSCPNTGHAETTLAVIESVKAVKRICNFPIVVKASVSQNVLEIARGLEGVAEAVSLNSVPWDMAFPGQRSPLWKLEKRVGGGGGGVSGKPAQAHNWKAVSQLLTDHRLPVIAPDIMDHGDLRFLKSQLCPDAYSFGAIHLRKPWLPTRIVEEENKRNNIKLARQ